MDLHHILIAEDALVSGEARIGIRVRREKQSPAEAAKFRRVVGCHDPRENLDLTSNRGAEVDGQSLMKEKILRGSDLGSNRYRIDIPRYIEFYRQGRLKIDEMITTRGTLDELNDLYHAQKKLEVDRSVIIFNSLVYAIRGTMISRCESTPSFFAMQAASSIAWI